MTEITWKIRKLDWKTPVKKLLYFFTRKSGNRVIANGDVCRIFDWRRPTLRPVKGNSPLLWWPILKSSYP